MSWGEGDETEGRASAGADAALAAGARAAVVSSNDKTEKLD